VPASGWIWKRHTIIEPPGLVTRLTADGPSASADAEVHWALLADPHISSEPSRAYNGFRPAEHLAAAVAGVLKSSPQAALIAGDLAWDQGLPEDYTRLRVMLEPLADRAPLCLMLGNHDNRQAFLTEFFCPEANGEPPVAKAPVVVEHGPIRWILLDSLIQTDIVAGLLGKAQRCWLRQLLETSDRRPTLIVVHHPLDDGDDSLLDGDRLLRLVRPFPQVKAIVTAHDHAYRTRTAEGIPIITLPALGMPFEEAEPVGWIEATLSATRGSFTFHAVGENRARDEEKLTLTWR
jgi:3',5'-cyclic AMP phosphodiesterase CpdA